MKYNNTDKKSSILIVDDTHENLKVLGNILKNNHYDVAFTDNGLQAIEIARKIIPTIILLDISMPGMDGFETCLKLKEIDSTNKIPVIFLTARTETDDIVKGFDTGAVDYITKPFNARELLTRIKNQISFQKNSAMLQSEIKERKKIQKKLEAANAELLKLSNLDGLTQIANRRHFDKYLINEIKRYERGAGSLSLIMCDVDYFKLYNDTYGHLEGDDCLKKIAKVLQNAASRTSDFSARYGGEEFAVILPGTDAKGAMIIGEIIRTRILALDISHKSSKVLDVVSISLGVSTLGETNSISIGSRCIEAADKALYKAKELGRNRCIHFDEILKP